MQPSLPPKEALSTSPSARLNKKPLILINKDAAGESWQVECKIL